MASSTGDNTKRKRPAQTGALIGVRLQPALLAKVDEWAAREGTTRPEAIRAMIEAALKP